MHWYALNVETGFEEIAADFLTKVYDSSSLLAIVPMRKVPEKKCGRINHVVKKMFPGYILVKTFMDAKTYYNILKAPKVFKILNNHKIPPKDYSNVIDPLPITTIEDHEILPILSLLDENYVINYSEIFLDNSRVLIKSGPLRGKEGIVCKVNRRKQRAKILLNFLGEQRTIDVGVEILKSVED